MFRYYFFIFSLIILNSCSSENTSEEQVVELENVASEQEPAPETTQNLSPLPDSLFIQLSNEVSGIEATMYENGTSFSLWEKQSARNYMSLVSSSAPLSLNEKQIGHIMFLSNGNQLYLAKVHQSGDEIYLVFKVGELSYYNVLLGQARDMFNNVKLKAK